MVTKFWLYDVIIYIYALSLLFYFTDAVSRNNGAKRMGAGLLVFVWVLQTMFFFYRMYEHRYIPVFTKFEIMFLFSWLLVTVSLALHRFFALNFLVFAVNVFGFTVLVLNLLTDPGDIPAGEVLQGGILWLHAVLAMISYTAFAVSATLSCGYLFVQHRLKRKQWTNALLRMPSMESLEAYASGAVLAGIPLLILSLTLGIVWIALHEPAGAPLFDIKVLTSVMILFLYGWQVLLKYRYHAAGRTLAWWNIVSFLLLFVNFTLANNYSHLHPWF